MNRLLNRSNHATAYVERSFMMMATSLDIRYYYMHYFDNESYFVLIKYGCVKMGHVTCQVRFCPKTKFPTLFTKLEDVDR